MVFTFPGDLWFKLLLVVLSSVFQKSGNLHCIALGKALFLQENGFCMCVCKKKAAGKVSLNMYRVRFLCESQKGKILSLKQLKLTELIVIASIKLMGSFISE